MKKTSILTYMKEHRLILDGGMGTLLQERGLAPGELPEYWNLSHSADITAIHKAYYEAGSNVVSMNTFGANSLKFDEEELKNILAAAYENAKRAKETCDTQKAPAMRFIALDIGPIGRLLKPYGDLDFEDAVRIFKQTITWAPSGPDLIFIETMSDSYETKAALLAAKEASDLPVFVSNAYGADGKLMTGASPAAMVAILEGMGADAIGANCSLGPKQLQSVVEEYLTYASVPVLLKPNAGLPRSENGITVYDVSPEEFATDMKEYIKMGVRIAGGCCGTTPNYIRATVNAVSDTPLEVASNVSSNKPHTIISSYTHALIFSDKPILIGERLNPTGKKRLKQALIDNDMDYVLGMGIDQQEKGVDVLDVNVGLPEIDEPQRLKDVTFELQSVVDLPLQIDTSDPTAMEKALRIYNGKAMINSVSGKDKVMKEIFPLVKKYGGVVVCLTLDDEGIPPTAKGRIDIAKRIIDAAASYGIDKKDLIFDPLAMAVSADPNAATETLKALRTLRFELGVHTILGVSNISFGLPQREAITSVFYAMALQEGLSGAIMNPNSADMMRVYYAYQALRGIDDNCQNYIANIDKYLLTASGTESTQSAETSSDLDPLARAIVKGLKEQAAVLTKDLLQEEEPLFIVNQYIIPALDIVGIGFEEKRMYLPQLLMSAEAAQSAFSVIKERMLSSSAPKETKGSIVIATVYGDIHDIGKNIVKLLLENYGFDVTDLGKDVPPEVICEKVKETKVPLLGLSALMTTTVPAMEETIRLVNEASPSTKIVVGGAVLTQEYADQIGADCYAKDAMATVRYAESLMTHTRGANVSESN